MPRRYEGFLDQVAPGTVAKGTEEPQQAATCRYPAFRSDNLMGAL